MGSWSRYTWMWTVALLLVTAGLFAAMLSVSDEGKAGAISTIGAVAFAAFAAAAAFDVARRLRPGESLRRQVVLIGLGMAALVAGDLLYWLYESVLGLSPYPSVADVLYVTSFPLLGGGFALALHAFTRGSKQSVALAVSTAVAFAASIAVWAAVLDQLVTDSEVTLIEKLLGALYPLGDVWLLLFPALALAIALGRFAGGRLAVPWSILTAGAVVMAATDTAYIWMDFAGIYTSGSPVDVGWWIAYATIGIGMVAMTDAQGLRGGRP